MLLEIYHAPNNYEAAWQKSVKPFVTHSRSFAERKISRVARSRSLSYIEPEYGCLVALFCRGDITGDKKIHGTCPDIDSTIRDFKYVATASGINEGFRMERSRYTGSYRLQAIARAIKIPLSCNVAPTSLLSLHFALNILPGFTAILRQV